MHGLIKTNGKERVLTPGNDDGVARVPDRGLALVVRDVHRSFSRALQMRIASHGVSMGQWFFLRALWAEDGLTQRELSQRVGMMEPTTVTALNGMERHGLVRRVRNPHDRRKVNIFLTPKGQDLREPLLDCAAEINRLAVQGIAASDIAGALDVLRRIAANLGGPAPIGNPDGDGEE
ncbi:MAG TPA: MarR family winged helix-turn-helix transcriptional regulator [Azospirillum sp.]